MLNFSDNASVEAGLDEGDLLFDLDPSFYPPVGCGDGRCQDLFPEFVYIVVIPASAALLLVLLTLFSLAVCCCVKRKKKAAAESEDQLACYDTVRRASISIRRMSTSNSTPLLDASRSGSMSLVRNDNRRRGFRPRDSCHSAPGTLQRHHRNRDSASMQDTPPPPPAPPPYGVPQHFPLADDEEAFMGGQDIPLQDIQADEDPADAHQNDQHEQPARPHRHHRRQRPYSAANGYTTH
ncbi:uncharacterized protein LOC143300563 [Babylonia areolata]|uniref:uncharacterized protein LOC143300563 n=1 Tax=Babylonia areolata TaxID=304850 RepID=UPI003FD5C58D